MMSWLLCSPGIAKVCRDKGSRPSGGQVEAEECGCTVRIASTAECMVPRPMIEAMLTDALASTYYSVVEVLMPTDG